MPLPPSLMPTSPSSLSLPVVQDLGRVVGDHRASSTAIERHHTIVVPPAHGETCQSIVLVLPHGSRSQLESPSTVPLMGTPPRTAAPSSLSAPSLRHHLGEPRQPPPCPAPSRWSPQAHWQHQRADDEHAIARRLRAVTTPPARVKAWARGSPPWPDRAARPSPSWPSGRALRLAL
jgi:hypothetical protein